jgi:hypothetical protein
MIALSSSKPLFSMEFCRPPVSLTSTGFSIYKSLDYAVKSTRIHRIDAYILFFDLVLVFPNMGRGDKDGMCE